MRRSEEITSIYLRTGMHQITYNRTHLVHLMLGLQNYTMYKQALIDDDLRSVVLILLNRRDMFLKLERYLIEKNFF